MSEENNSLKEIKSILENKWNQLEVEDNKEKLKELVMQLNAIEDFSREYQFTTEKIESGEVDLSQEQIDEHMYSLIEKWSFLFAAILNLDIQNPFITSYMFETLLDIEDEYLLDD